MPQEAESGPAMSEQRFFTIAQLVEKWNLPAERIWQEIEAEELPAEIIIGGKLQALPISVARAFSNGQSAYMETTRRPVSNVGLMMGLGAETRYYEAKNVRVSALDVQHFEAANQVIANTPTSVGRIAKLNQNYYSVIELADRWGIQASTVWQKIEADGLAAELVMRDGSVRPVKSHIAAAFSITSRQQISADPDYPQSEASFSEPYHGIILRPDMVRVSAKVINDYESLHFPSFEKWKTKDLWTVRETAFLLCGREPDVSAPADNELNAATDDLRRAITAGKLQPAEFLPYSDVPLEHYSLYPEAVIAWAQGRFAKFPFKPANTALQSTPVTDYQCGKILFDVQALSSRRAGGDDPCKGAFAEIALYIKNRLDSDKVAAPEDSELERSPAASQEFKKGERQKLLRQIGAIALLLAHKSGKYNRADKPNANKIAEDVFSLASAIPNAETRGLGNTELRQAIAQGLVELAGDLSADK